MIDVAIGISWLPVKPDGSKRVPLNFSIRTCSGTPCWSASEIAVANESIRPAMTEPSFAMRTKISPGRAVLVQADGDVALVAADRELVRERRALVGQLVAVRHRRTGRARLARAQRLDQAALLGREQLERVDRRRPRPAASRSSSPARGSSTAAGCACSRRGRPRSP